MKLSVSRELVEMFATHLIRCNEPGCDRFATWFKPRSISVHKCDQHRCSSSDLVEDSKVHLIREMQTVLDEDPTIGVWHV